MWLSWEQFVIIFSAALLEGVAGFDFGLVAAPAMGAITGLREAVVLLALPNLGVGILRVPSWKIPQTTLWRIMSFLGAGAAGAALGVLTLMSIPPTILKWSVGILVLLWAFYSFSKFRLQLDMRDETFFAYLGGILSGWLGGLSFCGSSLTVIYLDSIGLNRLRLAKMMHVCTLTFAVIQVTTLIGTGNFPLETTARGAMAVLPAFAGFLLGSRMRGAFSPALCYITGLVLMVLSSLSLLVFGAGGWK